MPCAFSGHDASAADSHLLATLGNVGELCKHCRVTIRNVLTRKDNVAVDSNIGGYLDDYIRMYVVLSSHALFLQRIAEFGQRIAADAAGQERGLSYHLKRFETRCHFPDVEVIPTGVLSADEFYDMIARGVMWKDVGAGLDHGLYAHRLQWHVLLATITGANLFTEPYLLTNGGGPNGASTSPVLLMYQKGLEQGNPDVAAAIGVILVVLVLILALVERKLVGDEES
mgnify:CR=1 FL=1